MKNNLDYLQHSTLKDNMIHCAYSSLIEEYPLVH